MAQDIGGLPDLRCLIGVRHPLDGEAVLALHVQPDPRGDQGFNLRRGLKDVRRQACPLDQVLKVVQHQERALAAQIVEELRLWLSLAEKGEPEGLGDRGHDRLDGAQRGQGDKEHAVWVAVDLSGRRLQGQPRLAAASWADEGQQPAGGVTKAIPDLREQVLAPDKGGQLGGQVRWPAGRGGRTVRRRVGISIPDAPVKLRRLFRRLDVQLLLERAAAGLVLGQGGGALPIQGQEAHQGAVGLLLPGSPLDEPPGTGERAPDLAPFLALCGQALKRGQALAFELFPHLKGPMLKGGAVAEGEPGHKALAVQFQGLLQEGQAALRWRVFARVGRCPQVSKAMDVQPNVGIWVQCRGLPVDGQPPLAQGSVDHREDAAQLGSGAALIESRPEQRRQRVAAVTAPCDCQVGEKGERFAAGEMHRLAVQLESRGAK